MLRSHVLPRLAREGRPDLWLHFVAEAVAFERKMAPLRGFPVAASVDADIPEPWRRSSSISLICTHPVSADQPHPCLLIFHGIAIVWHRHPADASYSRCCCDRGCWCRQSYLYSQIHFSSDAIQHRIESLLASDRNGKIEEVFYTASQQKEVMTAAGVEGALVGRGAGGGGTPPGRGTARRARLAARRHLLGRPQCGSRRLGFGRCWTWATVKRMEFFVSCLVRLNYFLGRCICQQGRLGPCWRASESSKW